MLKVINKVGKSGKMWEKIYIFELYLKQNGESNWNI